MKIGINARFLTNPYTGIGQYTINLLQALAKIDHENEYFLLTPELVELNLPENFHQIRLPEKTYKSASLRKMNWEHVLVPQEMEKLGVDLVHFLYPSNPNKKLPIPTIVTVHDVIPWVLPEYRKKLRSKLYHFQAKRALKKADHIITVSNFSKKEIENVLKIKEKNISVVHLATTFNPKKDIISNLKLRRDFFLYVGGYDKRKNVPMLIEAYQKFIANKHNVDLILVGGKDNGLEDLINEKYQEYVNEKIPIKPKGEIVFTDTLSPNELKYLYKEARALVHPSLYEGFNLPLVEAMSVGLPIIASDIPVNHEVTDENALFMDSKSLDAIGVAMDRFLNDKRIAVKMKEGGLLRAKDFNWKKSAEETLYVYNLFT